MPPESPKACELRWPEGDPTYPMRGTVGIIANPAAGKDIRRLASAASQTSDVAKIGIVRRALIGAVEGGAERVLIAHDHKSFGRQALQGLDERFVAATEIVGDDAHPNAMHTRRMAGLLARRGVGAVVSLGGDGTHRDIVKGWRDVVLVPISTGTNNVFPMAVEATLAGHAAAIAARAQSVTGIAYRAKVLDVVGDGLVDDLALVDLALLDAMFTASRAVWDTSVLRELVVTTAEPATIGLSSIAARVAPLDRRQVGAVHLCFGPSGSGETVRAPIGPGLYDDAAVRSVDRLATGESVTLVGPGVVAFDGERDLVLAPRQTVAVTVRANGPWVIDPAAALAQR